MISKEAAKYFSKEQRKAVCDWCQEKKKCSKCGFTEVPPKDDGKEDKSYSIRQDQDAR